MNSTVHRGQDSKVLILQPVTQIKNSTCFLSNNTRVSVQEHTLSWNRSVVCYHRSVILTDKHKLTDLIYWSVIQHYYMFRLSTSAIN